MTNDLNVSRETLDQLAAFRALVEKWNPKINLVSKKSLPEIWDRHILDSAQVFSSTDAKGSWVDLGSGGGFPGIVVAILSKDADADLNITLVESDQRKSAFLRSAIRELKLNAKVIADRIENIEPLNANIISGRALADLDLLLEYAQRHVSSNGVALFPKGRTWKNEHEQAQRRWSYTLDVIKSKTDADAAILKIKDIVRV